jgi:asparagine synthetase B (glutamine-hydrolysing)
VVLDPCYRSGSQSRDRSSGLSVHRPAFEMPMQSLAGVSRSATSDSRTPDRPEDRSLPDAVSFTRAALIENMRRHLVADVPVGIFLSGGIDSTVILALRD